MVDMIGKDYSEIAGLRGGEALECNYARRPEGCGHDTHCQTCTIRKAILNTINSGQAQKNIPAYVHQDRQTIEMKVSAYKVDNIVRVFIDQVETKKMKESPAEIKS
jgi:hypothetical protein